MNPQKQPKLWCAPHKKTNSILKLTESSKTKKFIRKPKNNNQKIEVHKPKGR